MMESSLATVCVISACICVASVLAVYILLKLIQKNLKETTNLMRNFGALEE